MSRSTFFRHPDGASRVRRGAALLIGATAAISCVFAPAAQARPAGAGPTLGGFTSQGLPVVVVPSTRGRRLVRIGISLEMTCTSFNQFFVPDQARDLPLTTAGAFNVSVVVRPKKESDGSVFAVTDRFSGRLHRKANTVTGTWHLHVDATPPGGPTDHCDSGAVSFTARL